MTDLVTIFSVHLQHRDHQWRGAGGGAPGALSAADPLSPPGIRLLDPGLRRPPPGAYPGGRHTRLQEASQERASRGHQQQHGYGESREDGVTTDQHKCDQ